MLTFIGLGLNDERGVTLEGLETARRSDDAYAEFYTSLMPNLKKSRLEELIGKKITVLERAQLEEQNGALLLNAAQQSDIVFFVPGDPMIATTHVSLRLSLAKRGIKSRLIHAPSITSAVCGATGLQNYKFGKSVTMPYDPPLPRSVLETISENYARGLHTLLLLDVKSEQNAQLTIPDAATRIANASSDISERLAVGVARIGAEDEKVKASLIGLLSSEEFGKTPHSIVVTGRLHFMEAEALKIFGGASDSDVADHQ